jgi:hypothetical protein
LLGMSGTSANAASVEQKFINSYNLFWANLSEIGSQEFKNEFIWPMKQAFPFVTRWHPPLVSKGLKTC